MNAFPSSFEFIPNFSNGVYRPQLSSSHLSSQFCYLSHHLVFFCTIPSPYIYEYTVHSGALFVDPGLFFSQAFSSPVAGIFSPGCRHFLPQLRAFSPLVADIFSTRNAHRDIEVFSPQTTHQLVTPRHCVGQIRIQAVCSTSRRNRMHGASLRGLSNAVLHPLSLSHRVFRPSSGASISLFSNLSAFVFSCQPSRQRRSSELSDKASKSSLLVVHQMGVGVVMAGGCLSWNLNGRVAGVTTYWIYD